MLNLLLLLFSSSLKRCDILKEKFQRDLINFFLSSGKFKVYELGQDLQNKTIWMVEGTIGQLDEIMVVTTRADLETTKERLENHINKSYVGNRGIGVTLVVLSSSNEGIISKEDSAINSDFLVASAMLQIDMEDLSLVQQIGYTNSLKGILAFVENKKRIQANSKTSPYTLTNLLIALNVLIFIFTAIASKSILDMDTGVLIQFGALVRPLIDLGEYHRLISPMFLHGGLLHLVMNMYGLNLLGRILEKEYGKLIFGIIYLFSGIAGSILSYFFSNPMAISVGASGAIFGLLGSSVVFALKRKNIIRKSFLQNILQVIVINLVIGFSVSRIDNAAHIGGLLGGLLITAALDYGISDK